MPLTLTRIRKQEAEQEGQEAPKGFAAQVGDTSRALGVRCCSEMKALQRAAAFPTPCFTD